MYTYIFWFMFGAFAIIFYSFCALGMYKYLNIKRKWKNSDFWEMIVALWPISIFVFTGIELLELLDEYYEHNLFKNNK